MHCRDVCIQSNNLKFVMWTVVTVHHEVLNLESRESWL